MNIGRLAFKVWARDRDVFMKTYKINFIPAILEPIFFLLALGFGLGYFIKQIDGITYAEFIAPALVAIAVMSAASYECTFGSYVRMHYQKTFDAIIATPVSIEEVIAGEMFWGATKSFIYGIIIFFVIFAFGLAKIPSGFIIIFASFLGGLLFAALSMVFTAIVPSIDSFNYYFYLLWTPMFLLCNTFFPIRVFPEILQNISFALPLTHIVVVMRESATGIITLNSAISIFWMLIVTSCLFFIAIKLMKKRLIK